MYRVTRGLGDAPTYVVSTFKPYFKPGYGMVMKPGFMPGVGPSSFRPPSQIVAVIKPTAATMPVTQRPPIAQTTMPVALPMTPAQAPPVSMSPPAPVTVAASPLAPPPSSAGMPLTMPAPVSTYNVPANSDITAVPSSAASAAADAATDFPLVPMLVAAGALLFLFMNKRGRAAA